MAQILAIEANPEHGTTLQRLVREKLNADLVLATSIDDAIMAIATNRPEVILTSCLMLPADDRQLAAHLRQDPSLRQLPVLALPPIVEPQEPVRTTLGARLARIIGRGRQQSKACGFDAVAERIRDTLDASRAIRPQLEASLPVEPPAAVTPMTDEELRVCCGLGSKQKRARRWTSADLPWISSVKLSWGLELSLLNISSTGILVESGIRLTPGSRTDIHLGGHRGLIVPARVVRSRVGAVDQRGVTYLAAAEFEQAFDTLLPSGAPTDPAAHLADVVARVREGAAGGASAQDLRLEFEAAVHELVSAREIRLRDAPVVENDGSDSVYFTVPTHDHSTAVLQVTFEPSFRPCAEEFATLKAAALAAAEIVEFTETARQLSLVPA